MRSRRRLVTLVSLRSLVCGFVALGAAASCEAYREQPALLPSSATTRELTPAAASEAPAPIASAPGPAAPSAAASAPKPAMAIEPNVIPLEAPITFEPGSDRLHTASDAALKKAAESIKANADVTLVRVEVHVGEQGLTAAGAMSLSQRRAMTVAKKLESAGVDCEHLLPVGFGDAQPERGVVLVRAAVRGKPTGGPMAGGGTVAGNPCR